MSYRQSDSVTMLGFVMLLSSFVAGAAVTAALFLLHSIGGRH